MNIVEVEGAGKFHKAGKSVHFETFLSLNRPCHVTTSHIISSGKVNVHSHISAAGSLFYDCWVTEHYNIISYVSVR